MWFIQICDRKVFGGIERRMKILNLQYGTSTFWVRDLLDGEGSDWQSIALDIGMEVTEALEPNDGRKHSGINQYSGKCLSGQYIKNWTLIVWQRSSFLAMRRGNWRLPQIGAHLGDPFPFSFHKITSSAGQKGYWSTSSTAVIQRMSLCSRSWGVPSWMEAWNRVRHSHKNASKWVKLYLFYPISDPLNFNSELFMSLSIVTSNMKRQIIILNIFARGKLIVLNCKLHSSTN